MTDIISPERRSALMARIKSRDTRPELRVRRMAHAMGLRFRLHRKDLPGTPDLVFPGRRIALFVHGCFWHRHPGCPKAYEPKSRVDFWQGKFRDNIARDEKAAAGLAAAGWKPVIIWECETEAPDTLEKIIRERIIDSV